MGEFVIVNGVARFSNLTLPHGFSTMALGNMSFNWGPEDEVNENVEKFYQRTGLSRANRVHMLPEHSDRILVVSKEDAGKTLQCDSLVTTEKGLTLSLCPADCFPIIINDREHSFISLIHAGWRGTDKEVAKQTVEFIRIYLRVRPYELHAWIGPGIHGCCYDEEIEAQKKTEWQPFLRGRYAAQDTKVTADLLSYNVFQLLLGGVPIENITLAKLCTYCSAERQVNPVFFSHHRVKDSGEQEGRFAAAVAL